MSCIATVGRTLLEIEELNNLKYELETSFYKELHEQEHKLENISYIKLKENPTPHVKNTVNIPFLTFKKINDERIETLNNIIEIEQRIEMEKKMGKSSSSTGEFHLRKQRTQTPPRQRKITIHEFDLQTNSNGENNTNNNSNNNHNSTGTNSNRLKSKDSSGDAESPQQEHRKKSKKNNIKVVKDLKSLSSLREEDIDFIVSNFSPLPKKYISKSIKQEAIMYLNDFLDEKFKRHILPTPTMKLKGGNCISFMKGPHHCSIDIQLFDECFACKSISTYPKRVNFHTRDGDPICDRYFVKLYENRIFASLSDGYSWGERSRKAAKKACKAVTMYLDQRHKEYHNLIDFATGIMEGFADAHRRVLEGVSEAIWESGATTLLNCNLLELDETQSPPILLKNGNVAKWAILGGHLGDTKAFLYSQSTKRVSDLTKNTRIDLSADPGGKLGNYVDGKPDLRNYNIFVRGCEEGDIVLLLTDAVYDNFNPIKMGYSPEDFGMQGSWDSLEFASVNRIISRKTKEQIAMIIEQSASLEELTNKVLDECHKRTENPRQFSTQNPGDRVPTDYKLFPGTLGHCTVVAFKVGTILLTYEKWMGKHSSKTANFFLK